MVANSPDLMTTEATSPKSNVDKLSPRMDSIQEEDVVAVPSPEQRSAVEDPPEAEKPRETVEETEEGEKGEEEDSAAAMQTFGFGAGMRMYAKSLAEAEKAEKEAATKEVVPLTKEDEPETPLTTAIEEKPSTTIEVEAKLEKSVEATKTEDEQVIELLSKSEEKMTSVSCTNFADTVTENTTVYTAQCGNLVEQFKETTGEFFRRAEEATDDVHEKLCERSGDVVLEEEPKENEPAVETDDNDDKPESPEPEETAEKDEEAPKEQKPWWMFW